MPKEPNSNRFKISIPLISNHKISNSLIVLLLLISVASILVLVQVQQDIRQRAEGTAFPCNRPNQVQIGGINSNYTCPKDANGCVKTPYARYLYATDQNGDGIADPQNPYDQPWCDNNCADPVKSCSSGTPPPASGSVCSGNTCSDCILNARTDILPFYKSNGWDTSCGNQNNAVNNWCSIDPSGCNTVKTTTCSSQCGGTAACEYNRQGACDPACCGANHQCPSGQSCSISNGNCLSGYSCNPNTAPTPTTDPCPGKHNVNGACDPACCSSNTQCPSGQSCSISNGGCQSGKSCNPNPTATPTPTTDPCPGKHNVNGACDPACCASNSQCPSGQTCNIGNGGCKSGYSCNSTPAVSTITPTPTQKLSFVYKRAIPLPTTDPCPGKHNVNGACDPACCASNSQCPSGQTCNIGNGGCKSGYSCNPNTAPTPTTDPCPGKHNVNGACDPACCASNSQCPSGQTCNIGNGGCKSGYSCNSNVPTPTPTKIPAPTQTACPAQTCTYTIQSANCTSGVAICSGSGPTGQNNPGCTFTAGCSNCNVCFSPSPTPIARDTRNTCNGKYSLSSPLKQNFGDPSCNFDKYGLYNLIKATDPVSADKWMAISFCESTFNPNAYNGFSVARGAWGLFQMAGPWNSNGKYDRGDTVWGQQTSNAIMYNNTVIGRSFGYWECRNATYWPK